MTPAMAAAEALAHGTVTDLTTVAAASLHDRDRAAVAATITRAIIRHTADDPTGAAALAAEAIVQLAERRRAEPEPITLDIPAPCDWISSNARTGWRNKSKLTKRWREAAGWRAKEAGIPAMQRAEIEALVILPTRRRRDPHNLIDTFKACCDGLVDVGVLPDDDATHLTLTRIDLGEPDRTAERGILRLLITDMGAPA
jgi:crossover junction endodeoxyribonuclease RusA